MTIHVTKFAKETENRRKDRLIRLLVTYFGINSHNRIIYAAKYSHYKSELQRWLVYLAGVPAQTNLGYFGDGPEL